MDWQQVISHQSWMAAGHQAWMAAIHQSWMAAGHLSSAMAAGQCVLGLADWFGQETTRFCLKLFPTGQAS